jgi:cell fate (sporulation/competence/biofilm development) regulator YmcA (YheA/YmcA/DUF963 family)
VDIETVRNWATTLSVIISAGSVIFIWLKTPGEKIKQSIAAVATKVDGLKESTAEAIDELKEQCREDLKNHDRRIQSLEDEVKHLPTSEELAELQVTVTRVEGDVKRIEGTLDRVDHVVGRIDDYLRANR